MKEIVDRIERALQNNINIYFKCKNSDEQIIKIRVSDHRMNELNNNGERTLSFISGNDRKQDAIMSNYEWLFDEELLTNNYETVEDIIKEFELIKMID